MAAYQKLPLSLFLNLCHFAPQVHFLFFFLKKSGISYFCWCEMKPYDSCIMYNYVCCILNQQHTNELSFRISLLSRMDLGFARCVDNRKPQLALHCSGQQIIPEFMCHVSWKVKKKCWRYFIIQYLELPCKSFEIREQ